MIDRCSVEATIGERDGVPTFNGLNRDTIVYKCYINLNYYQMACKPRLIEEEEDDDEEIDLSLFYKLKEGALLCPVCYDVFKNPVNVKQCLHKFCSQCIEDYNRKVKKECPGCRH